MKNLGWILVALLAITPSPSSADTQPEIEPLDESRFAVHFKSREFDSETNRTRFRYRVNPEGASDAIRFVIGYGACGDVQIKLDPDTPKRVEEIRTDYLDAETGIYGVEWTSRMRRWRGTPFSFEIVGDVPLGSVRVAIQEGDQLLAGLVPGPNCAPLLPTESSYTRR